MIVCLKLTSWTSYLVGAKHWYGYLIEYENGDAERHEVRCVLNSVGVRRINKEDRTEGTPSAYMVGELSRRFWSRQILIDCAKVMAQDIWGDDVQIFLGDRYFDLEDMEKI